MNLNPPKKDVSRDDAHDESGLRDFPDRLLSVQEAARFLGLSVSTLNKLRLTGGGPRFAKLGRRCLYDITDLKKWASERKRISTSEYQSTKQPRQAKSCIPS
jgi:excisionase family DNA binding protein